MRIFGFNISRSPVPVEKTSDPYIDRWLKGEETPTGIPALTSAYEQVVWVYRAINVLAEQIGNIPFLFSSGERGRENLITSGPLMKFYDQPHPQINRFQYWELRIIWLMLRGECFRVPIYSDASRSAHHAPRRLQRVLILNPDHFHHIIEDHQLLGWRYTGFGQNTPLESQVFLPEEVWFEKLPNPFNFWRGLGPLQVAGLAAQTDFAASSFMKGVMENNGDLGLVVRMEKQPSPDQREQLNAALRERKRRAGTADNPLMLWNAAEIVQPHLSSSDLQFLENRKFSRAEICAAFGVPEEIVTTTDNSKYDVVSGARLNFIEHRVAPMCRRLEAAEDKTVKLLDPGAVGWFDLDSLPIMQKAQRDRLGTARSVFDMGVPFNELNRVLDLGFRKLPWGDRGYVGSNLLEVGEEARPAKMIEASRIAAKASEGKDAGAGETLARLCGFFENLRAGKTPEDQQSGDGTPVPIRHVASTIAAVGHIPEAPIDPQIISRFRRFRFEQRQRILANIAALQGSSSEANLALIFDPAAEAARVEAMKLPEGRAREILQREAGRLSAKLTESLREGLEGGESKEQLSARVRGICNDEGLMTKEE